MLLAQPQLITIPELSALHPADYVIPATLIWELDRLKQRLETRERARAAQNVLQQLVDRGAAVAPVSWGEGVTVRLAKRAEEVPEPGLDMDLADDRILAMALSLGEGALLATTEFALYAKALASGIEGLFLPQYASSLTILERRERESIRSGWARIVAATTAESVGRRGLSFMELRAVRDLLAPIIRDGSRSDITQYVMQWRTLRNSWQFDFYAAAQVAFYLTPPPAVDGRIQTFYEPYTPDRLMKDIGKQRVESSEERALRIRAEEANRSDRQHAIADHLYATLEIVHALLVELTGDELV